MEEKDYSGIIAKDSGWIFQELLYIKLQKLLWEAFRLEEISIGEFYFNRPIA